MPPLNYQNVINSMTIVHNTVLEMKREFDNIKREQAELKTFITDSMNEIRISLATNFAAPMPGTY